METPSLPEAFSLTVPVRARWSDGDLQGVVNNAVYMTLFEEARHAYFTGLEQLEDNHFPFLLAQTNVLFIAPGRCGEVFDVELATTRLGSSSFEQAYRIKSVSGEVLCTGQARLVCYDEATGKSRPMTDAFRAAIEAFEANARGGVDAH